MGSFAAIDCGTNTLRLLISDGSIDQVRDKVEVGLGDGFTPERKVIRDDSLLAASAALWKFKVQLMRHGVSPDDIRITGTSAPRVAENGEAFKQLVRDIMGKELELIDGAHEAQLGFRGASRSVTELAPDSPARFMTVDIGGGSTEFCIGGPDGLDARVSTEVGSNWITGRFAALAEERAPERDPADTPSIVRAHPGILTELRGEVFKEIVAQLRSVNRERVAGGQDPVDLRAVRTLIGVGGTAETLAAVVNRQPFSSDPVWMPTSGIGAVADELYQSSVERRCDLGVDSRKRAKKIPAGALILGEVMQLLGEGIPPQMIVSPYDLRDGVITELASASRPETTRAPSTMRSAVHRTAPEGTGPAGSAIKKR